ncbi:hypothetical protein POM88_003798 [Heracleum sosnowskyi]|uniref:F-box domain-containing protein n=1 Tax=Heracleum sosnowskyi TaxID=360622 RepID=A0AAD8NDV9_9APIA|nr:hypothetical protein POM88_003798 [Heracleum sosnowskyi]
MDGAWENLNSDCLVNVFRRLDLESKLLDIPFVCKQWNQALLNPLCWQELVFPVDVSQSRLADAPKNGESYNNPGLIKFVVRRSQGCATRLELPNDISEEDLVYIPDV